MPVQLQGATAVRKALAQVEPTLAKNVNKEITAFLKPVVKDARGFIPSNDSVPSGWLQRPNAQGRWANRFYDAQIVRKSITYRATPSKPNRSGFVALASLFNKSAAGAIYETAGRKSGVRGNFTPRLGGELKGKGQKMTGRAMYRAFEEDQGKAVAGVVRAIEGAVAKFDSLKDKV